MKLAEDAFAGVTQSQLDAARALPENGAGEWPPILERIPAQDYTSLDRYEEEQRTLFRRLPVPVAPSVQLTAGQHLCSDGHGFPILLTRDRDGRAYAFVNSCRHRGSKLTEATDPQNAKLLVCPYHAWSYDLTGRLTGVPRIETFAGLDKSEIGLVRLPCAEIGGMIWVILDPRAPGDFSHVEPLRDELAATRIGEMHLFAKRVHMVDANWKLIMDTFLENYHVTRLHRESLGFLFEDVVTITDMIGAHIRTTTARRGFTRDFVGQAGKSFDALRKAMTFVYNFAPGGVLINSPDYANLLLLMPQGVDRTRIENYMLTRTKPDERLQEKWGKSLALTDDLAFPEDFLAARLSHEGLAAGGQDSIIIGGMEEAISRYHGSLATLIDQAQ